MIARSRAVVAAGGRLAELACQPPLTLRQVASADPRTCALCLVGSAAGPLAGDDLALRVEVRGGASATLQAAGASIAQGRPGEAPSALRIEAVLAAGASLRADPAPLIVRPGGRVDAHVKIDLGASALAEWTELIVLGTGDGSGPPGPVPAARPAPAATLRWDVTRDGAPVLRQLVDLSSPEWLAWPGMLAGRRVLASVLLAGRGVRARTIVATPTAVAQRLADDAALVTVLADDAASAQRMATDLTSRLRCS